MDVILSVTWKSAYQSVRGLVLHFGKCWRAAGLELVEIDLSSAGWQAQLREILNTRRVRFVFCTSGVGTNISVDNENLWAKLRLPVFSLLLDHPAYNAVHHRTQPKSFVLAYMFRDHADYQISDVRADNIVTSIDFGIPDLPVRPIEELNGAPPRLIFAKTGNAPEDLAATWREAPRLERIIYDTLDELQFEKTGAVYAAGFPAIIQRVASAHRIELQAFSLLSRFLIVQIDDYTRRLKSTAIAKAILPFEVDVFGTAWEHIDTTGAKARFHGPVDYARVEAEFCAATASLTMNPNIALSAHDRFFTALGAGIMPVTDRNPYIAETFPELLPYTFDFTPGSITAAIEHVVGDPETALATARAARARTRPAAWVDKAAAEVLEVMQSASFLNTVPKATQLFFVP